MFFTKRFLPLFLIIFTSCMASKAPAQESIPLYTETYCVQVEWYFWRSGGTYWATEYESTNLAEAEKVFELFEAAFENGSLCDLLGCNLTNWVPIDVRLKTRYDWNIFPVSTSTVTTTVNYLRD